jgi:mannose-1-phosphate guanylyltransferase
MILCAGLGTRLRPMTLERPKPAVPLLNRPLVGYTLQLARSLGTGRIVINTHWLPEVMRLAAEAECRALGLEMETSHEPEILGTGGGLRQARDRGLVARDRHLLVLNGDVLSDVDLASLVRTHLLSQAAATMVLRPMPADASYTPIEVDASGRVHRIGKHGIPIGTSPLLFTGAHLLAPEALDLLPAGESSVIASAYAPLLERGARIQSVFESGLWLDLGDPAGYLGAHRAALRNEIPAPALDRLGLRRPAIDPRAIVAPSAVLTETVVGAEAVIGEGASLSRCVVWPGARVPPDARWDNAIVTPRTVFAAGSDTSR